MKCAPMDDGNEDSESMLTRRIQPGGKCRSGNLGDAEFSCQGLVRAVYEIRGEHPGSEMQNAPPGARSAGDV